MIIEFSKIQLSSGDTPSHLHPQTFSSHDPVTHYASTWLQIGKHCHSCDRILLDAPKLLPSRPQSISNSPKALLPDPCRPPKRPRFPPSLSSFGEAPLLPEGSYGPWRRGHGANQRMPRVRKRKKTRFQSKWCLLRLTIDLDYYVTESDSSIDFNQIDKRHPCMSLAQARHSTNCSLLALCIPLSICTRV